MFAWKRCESNFYFATLANVPSPGGRWIRLCRVLPAVAKHPDNVTEPSLFCMDGLGQGSRQTQRRRLSVGICNNRHDGRVGYSRGMCFVVLWGRAEQLEHLNHTIYLRCFEIMQSEIYTFSFKWFIWIICSNFTLKYHFLKTIFTLWQSRDKSHVIKLQM